MRLADWLEPPRHLVLLFAGVTLVPAAALVWLGWQFFERDRVFEEQQISRRLTTLAEQVSAGIGRQLEIATGDLPARLADPEAAVGSDAVLVRIGPAGVSAKAGAPLLFSPLISETTATIPSIEATGQPRWAEAIALEYRERDFDRAARAFKALSATSDADARAMALVAAARNLRAMGRWEEALGLYRALERETTAMILGEPADLVARAAMCSVLEKLGRRDELARVAGLLAEDLARGRWSIDRATFEARVAEVRTRAPLAIDDDDLARALALEGFWAEHRGKSGVPPAGHRAVLSNSRGILLVWRAAGDEVTVLSAGREYVARAWVPAVTPAAARVSFKEPNEHAVKLPAATLDLPWDLYVTDTTAAADSASFAARRRLLGWALATLVILIPAGGWVVWRAVQKELAVARLQADFVSAVSHEFRTPLTSMAHLTERLQRDSASIPDERKRQYYDALVRDTDRLRRFVETLLDFGRMEAGTASLRTREDDLAAVVSDVVTEFRGEVTAAHHDIRVETNGVLPPVSLDREAFSRALWNVLDNASKYSPAGSPITIAIRREPHSACVDVSDLGAGIPADERRQIFQKFVRGTDPKAAGIRGTGVGLALVDRIIRAHGGEVRLESVVGQGSTFSLVLPIARGAEP